MAEELQQILEKIKHDGVDKANAEAEAIISAAKAKADALLKDAEEKAASMRSQAETDAKAFAERAETSIRQAARDVVIDVKDRISSLFDGLVANDVSMALDDADAVAAIARDAVKSLISSDSGDAEISGGDKLVQTLRAQFASSMKVEKDDKAGKGFLIRIDGGRIEYDFSEAAIAAALARHLRPALANLVK